MFSLKQDEENLVAATAGANYYTLGGPEMLIECLLQQAPNDTQDITYEVIALVHPQHLDWAYQFKHSIITAEGKYIDFNIDACDLNLPSYQLPQVTQAFCQTAMAVEEEFPYIPQGLVF